MSSLYLESLIRGTVPFLFSLFFYGNTANAIPIEDGLSPTGLAGTPPIHSLSLLEFLVPKSKRNGFI